MAQYAGIVVFGGGGRGWTEKYYLLASTPSGAATNLLAVIAKRLPLLHPSLYVQTAFISDVAIRGDSTQIVSAHESGTATTTGGYLDLDACLLLKWQVGVFLRNKTFMRGAPEEEQFNGFWSYSLGFNADLNLFGGAVISNCVMPITSRNPTPPPNYIPVSYAPILSVTGIPFVARRKTGRPFGQLRGRRLAP